MKGIIKDALLKFLEILIDVVLENIIEYIILISC